VKQRPQKRCIFCGGKPTTKEHIWSEWMHPYLPTESDARNEVSKVFAQKNSPASLPAVSHARPGPVKTKRIRVVCGMCNNGWMSRLETTVKPIILPLIQGKVCTLDEEGQALLARWIAVKAIVTEYSQDDQRLTPTADRAALANEYTIPSYFSIRVGRNASSWRTLFFRHSTTISLDRLATAPQMDGVERNIQQITMLFDALIIQVLAVRVTGHRIQNRIAPQIGTRLWPVQTPTLDFGQFAGTGDDELIACTHSLAAFLDVNQRGWLPMPKGGWASRGKIR
jgi:hypothetical protein